ncbi:MAG: hypothetical protein H0T56_18365 [Pseudaminobacter sp.]|nr:hypothetical protein [Pseudaminobacter sp.]
MARVRSPAYPSLSLPSAVDMIRKVHAVQQRTPEPRGVVLRHMGYAGESGRSLKAISSLIKYGFLEKHGSESGLRVTERAMAILYPHTPDDKVEALHEAANEPELFVDIFERWPDARPTEESLKAFLVRRGFNANSVGQVARAFYDTFDLVSGRSDSYDSHRSSEPDSEMEDAPVSETQQKKEGGLGFVVRKSKEMSEASVQADIRNVTKPIFDFETVRVNTVIDNREDLIELIARLEQLKMMLSEKTQH